MRHPVRPSVGVASYRLSLVIGAFAALAIAAAVPADSATPTYDFKVNGTWSNPVLSGNIIDGATGVSSFMNNSSTAACNIGCPVVTGSGAGSDTLVWGVGPGSSTVNINGHLVYPPVKLGQVFDAAEITYTNGTSQLNSLIFGATLTLRFVPAFGAPAPDVADPISISVPIVTTANTGTPRQNADWVGPFGTPQPLTFNVLEGETAHAELYGMLVDDPHFQPTLLVSTDPNGFIGNGEPVGVPEPATWVMMLLGVFSLGALLRTQRKPVAAPTA